MTTLAALEQSPADSDWNMDLYPFTAQPAGEHMAAMEEPGGCKTSHHVCNHPESDPGPLLSYATVLRPSIKWSAPLPACASARVLPHA
jgi:hypothetical protein